ncbi:MAG: tRNA pseudouridine(55) synthase TruB [Planctomycetaceae bacterium]|nr:tRNA pseudouridine(55) synthase TruB [Planctomycetaceae bacterium]
MSTRPEWFGFFNVDKPAGWTSRRAVDHVKPLIKPAKVGHAGTLDPLASGVLVVCVGRATRLVPYLHELTKSYVGEFLLGVTSDTADIEGEVRALSDAPAVTREQLLAVLPRFVGRIQQTPPVYSAVKIQGRRAYELARQGQTPDIAPRDVEIARLELREADQRRFVLEIECSTGTYVRSLGRDMARVLGSDAVMRQLTRTRIGPFDLSAAVTPAQLTTETIAQHLIPASAAVAHLPTIPCDDAALGRVKNGLSIDWPHESDDVGRGECALVTPSGQLAAIGEFLTDDRRIAPRHVFL